ncbi:hypothetical protein [Xanthomonas phage BUDD]|nr:hypothetical protein [Xanthomonas phage BUDD]
MILAKWALVLVMSTSCYGSGCAPGITVTSIPVESKELCLQQANYLSTEARKVTLDKAFSQTTTKAMCIQVAR